MRTGDDSSVANLAGMQEGRQIIGLVVRLLCRRGTPVSPAVITNRVKALTEARPDVVPKQRNSQLHHGGARRHWLPHHIPRNTVVPRRHRQVLQAVVEQMLSVRMRRQFRRGGTKRVRQLTGSSGQLTPAKCGIQRHDDYY